MEKRGLISIFLAVFLCTNLSAQEPVHGVNGYYALTAQQMQSDGKVILDNNGRQIPEWYPNLSYEGDYLKVQMGLSNKTPTVIDENQKVFQFRTGITFVEEVPGEGRLVITKDYPVLAFKFGLPKNNERLSGNDYIEPEYLWYSPSTGAREKVPLSGLDGNGRHRHVLSFPYLVDENGKDSLNITRRYDNGKELEIWAGQRVEDEYADVVFFVDFSHIFNEQSLESFKLHTFGIGFFAQADTLKSTPNRDESGKIISYTYAAETKTLDELPAYYFKWLRTFPSADEFREFVSHNDGDGSDPHSNNQLVLQTKIYRASQFAANYKFADESVLTPFNAAIQLAQTVYNTTAPNTDKTSGEWQAWDATVIAAIESLANAQEAFLAAIAMETTNVYNKITSGDGNYELTLGETATVGSYTGQLLTVGGTGAGTGFSVIPVGNANGQTAYKLASAQGVIVVSKDTLMLVPTTQLTDPGNAAAFIFSNRYLKEEPLYDIKVGAKFYYITDEGKLDVASALPDVENLEDVLNYLFVVQDASGSYDPSNDNAPLFEAWEFNTPVTFNPADQWETDTLKVDGWRMNRWRMHTRVNQTTEDGNGYLTIKAAPAYYVALDTFHTEPLQTVYPTTVLICREHGQYATIGSQDPIDQVRDSLYLININSYKRRYFAIKWASNNRHVTMSNFNFLVKKGIDETIISPDNLTGQKGDVRYWDLLALGLSYGDKGAAAQYLSFDGIASPDDTVFIDWIRTYETIDQIPNETFGFTGLELPTLQSPVSVYADGKAIRISCEGSAKAAVCRIDGVLLEEQRFNNETSISVAHTGLYIVSVNTENKVYTSKILVK
jgi:hypothetical protein